MIELHHEGDFVGIATRDRAEHTESGGDAVTPPLDGQLHNLGRIEIDRVGGEGGPGGVLDALVHRQDGDIAGARQAPMVENALQIAQQRRVAVAVADHPVDIIGSRQVELVLVDGGALMGQQGFRFGAQQGSDLAHGVDSSFKHRRIGLATARTHLGCRWYNPQHASPKGHVNGGNIGQEAGVRHPECSPGPAVRNKN